MYVGVYVCTRVYELMCACTTSFLVLRQKLFACVQSSTKIIVEYMNLTHRSGHPGYYRYVVFVVMGKGENTTMMHF